MRIEAIAGGAPHIQVWMNGTRITDWTDSVNHSKTGMAGGMIALQAHRTDPAAKSQRWIPGGYHRYRKIKITELK